MKNVFFVVLMAFSMSIFASSPVDDVGDQVEVVAMGDDLVGEVGIFQVIEGEELSTYLSLYVMDENSTFDDYCFLTINATGSEMMITQDQATLERWKDENDSWSDHDINFVDSVHKEPEPTKTISTKISPSIFGNGSGGNPYL